MPPLYKVTKNKQEYYVYDDVELETIQMPGAKRMNAKDYLRGHNMQTAICLGKA